MSERIAAGGRLKAIYRSRATLPPGDEVFHQEKQTRGLNRNRQPALKAVFKGAALQVVTKMTSHPLHADYQRLLEAGTKPNLARLTIARRISAAALPPSTGA